MPPSRADGTQTAPSGRPVSRPLRPPQAAERPEAERGHERERQPERQRHVRRIAGDQAAHRLEHVGDRVERGERLDPALEQVERDVDRREEQRQEDGHLHHRAGLDRPEPHRDARGPEQAGDVDERGEQVHAEDVDPVAADAHPRHECHDRQHGRRHAPAQQRSDPVAEHDPGPVRRGQEQPAREAVLEVARDPEAREDAAERGRLEQDEAELERRVALVELEARHLGDLREPARERHEEEERERERRQEQARVRENVLQRPPGDAARDRPDPHVRSSRWRSAHEASTSETTAITTPIPKPSASAWRPSP